MSKMKRLTDILKGLFVIGLIGAITPFIVLSLGWYCVKVWNLFF
tara:strand:- start:5921 stop:6052 length:132 start_codon:yes stop_codon:yes gene_type:complete